jgi:hypothetical protein
MLLGTSDQPNTSGAEPTVQQNQPSDDVVDASDYLNVTSADIDTAAQSSLSQTDIDGLVFMREEEKLARDVYVALYKKWNIRAFDNISQSESTHMAAVKSILDAYDIVDPVGTNDYGVFANQTLQGLYTTLVAQGSTSALDALMVGAEIEDLDIKDLQRYVAQTTNPDIVRVYQNLMKGSRNHLRTFVGLVQAQGGTYEARHLTQEEVDAIVNSPRERGPAVY